MVFTLNPFRELEQLKRELETMFDTYQTGVISTVFPAVNVYENDNEIRVVAQIPGAKKDDLGIDYNKGTLKLYGKISDGLDDLRLLRGERKTGEFEKNVAIGTQIEEEKISAKYENGLLTITLPKREEIKPKQIKIDVK